MEPNLGTRGATRQSWKPDSIRHIVKEIQDNHPKAGKDRLIRLFAERLAEDDRARDLASEYIIDNCLSVQASYQRRETTHVRPTPEQVIERQEAKATKVENLKAQILLLNLLMPNGKLARHCTGTELARFGGIWVKIGKKIGHRLLEKAMNEEQLQTYF